MRGLEFEESMGFFKAKTSGCHYSKSCMLQLGQWITRVLLLINDLSLIVFAMLFGLACGFSVLAYVWITLLLPFAYVRFATMIVFITILSPLVAYYNPYGIKA
ncbi:hypothetical protein ES703_69732 [subsurface metagenome]